MGVAEVTVTCFPPIFSTSHLIGKNEAVALIFAGSCEVVDEGEDAEEPEHPASRVRETTNSALSFLKIFTV